MKVKSDHRSKFFQLLKLENLIYCDDHSLLSSTTAVQIWIISYILHTIPILLATQSTNHWECCLLNWLKYNIFSEPFSCKLSFNTECVVIYIKKEIVLLYLCLWSRDDAMVKALASCRSMWLSFLAQVCFKLSAIIIRVVYEVVSCLAPRVFLRVLQFPSSMKTNICKSQDQAWCSFFSKYC